MSKSKEPHESTIEGVDAFGKKIKIMERVSFYTRSGGSVELRSYALVGAATEEIITTAEARGLVASMVPTLTVAWAV